MRSRSCEMPLLLCVFTAKLAADWNYTYTVVDLY